MLEGTILHLFYLREVILLPSGIPLCDLIGFWLPLPSSPRLYIDFRLDQQSDESLEKWINRNKEFKKKQTN